MIRLAKIACAIWTLLAGLLWTLSQVASGFSVPGWVPATGLLAAGIFLVMTVAGV